MTDHLYPVLPSYTNISGDALKAPTEGQIWHNKTNKHLYVWDGDEWIPLSSRHDYAANWGQIAHGEQIPRPIASDGYEFEYHECIWSTSPAFIENFDSFVCFADADGYVTVQYRTPGSGTFEDGVANYIIVGIRGNRNRGYTIPPIVPDTTPPVTPSVTPTITVSSSLTPTPTPSPSDGAPVTPTPTITPTVSVTPTPSPSAIPPLTITVTDPDYGSDASLLSAECYKNTYDSVNRDTGYLTCGASSMSQCPSGSCAPEPGDHLLGPVMRISVSGGVPPYVVELKNFQLDSDYDITNSNFESGNTGWTAQAGTGTWTIQTTGSGAQTGSGYGQFTNLGNRVIINNTRAPVEEGQSITASCGVNQWSNDAGEAGGRIRLVFFDAMDSIVSFAQGNLVDSTSNGNWGTSTVTASVPAGAVTASVGIYLFRVSGASVHVTVDNFTWNIGNYGTSECFYVGGQSIPSIPNVGTVKTYNLATSGASTPIISLNGLCGTSNFLRRGTFDIVATDSALNVETVEKMWKIERTGTNPSGSSGGGGFYDPNCVTSDSVIFGSGIASSVAVGDEMIVADVEKMKLSSARVSKAHPVVEQCVRVVTKTGIELECSRTAELATSSGTAIKAADSNGALLIVMDDGALETDEVVEVIDIGEREVMHITCENNYFMAGKISGRYLLHHNLKEFQQF